MCHKVDSGTRHVMERAELSHLKNVSRLDSRKIGKFAMPRAGFLASHTSCNSPLEIEELRKHLPVNPTRDLDDMRIRIREDEVATRAIHRLI